MGRVEGKVALITGAARGQGRDRRIVAKKADVRDRQALSAAIAEGVAELGRLDIVSINAGIASVNHVHDISDAANAIPIPWVEPADISNAVLFLASDEARYVTGIAMPVDAGFLLK